MVAEPLSILSISAGLLNFALSSATAIRTGLDRWGRTKRNLEDTESQLKNIAGSISDWRKKWIVPEFQTSHNVDYRVVFQFLWGNTYEEVMQCLGNINTDLDSVRPRVADLISLISKNRMKRAFAKTDQVLFGGKDIIKDRLTSIEANLKILEATSDRLFRDKCARGNPQIREELETIRWQYIRRRLTSFLAENLARETAQMSRVLYECCQNEMPGLKMSLDIDLLQASARDPRNADVTPRAEVLIHLEAMHNAYASKEAKTLDFMNNGSHQVLHLWTKICATLCAPETDVRNTLGISFTDVWNAHTDTKRYFRSGGQAFLVARRGGTRNDPKYFTIPKCLESSAQIPLCGRGGGRLSHTIAWEVSPSIAFLDVSSNLKGAPHGSPASTRCQPKARGTWNVPCWPPSGEGLSLNSVYYSPLHSHRTAALSSLA